ncbi:MAG: NTP transferase domain-containing protein, partial [Gammaproteobacteria bacterium]|nr:NTP transferase domain-containing protein [Gammaproteobacteria bacterium]
MSIAGVILAGGQAKRYHQLAKGNIVLSDGKTIIDHQIQALKESGIKDIVISANDASLYQQYNLPIIPDQEVDAGPLAGIAAALHFLQEKYSTIITLPCDAPNITANKIKRLITATTNNDDLVYTKTKIRAHPLFAHIKTHCLPKILQQLTNHHYKILDTWQQLAATAIEFSDETAFLNINTINDLKTLTNTNIWIITGAGHNVGKTTLATELKKTLPASLYMKIGHGVNKPNKPTNYFQDINSALEFLCKNITAHEHIIIETNKKELFDYGNYIIFIPHRDAIHRIFPPNQDIRPDAEILKSMANIKIHTKCHPVLNTGSRSTRSVQYSNNIMDSVVKPRNDDKQLQINKEQIKTTWQNTLKEIEPNLRKKIINALTKQLDYGAVANRI